jgi:hypothetical protein
MEGGAPLHGQLHAIRHAACRAVPDHLPWAPTGAFRALATRWNKGKPRYLHTPLVAPGEAVRAVGTLQGWDWLPLSRRLWSPLDPPTRTPPLAPASVRNE